MGQISFVFFFNVFQLSFLIIVCFVGSVCVQATMFSVLKLLGALDDEESVKPKGFQMGDLRPDEIASHMGK